MCVYYAQNLVPVAAFVIYYAENLVPVAACVIYYAQNLVSVAACLIYYAQNLVSVAAKRSCCLVNPMGGDGCELTLWVAVGAS